MHEVEGQVEADYEKPEMQLTERLVVHLPRHLRGPVIKGPKKSEENAADNHIVKMRDHEIRISQVPSQRRDTQHDSSEAGRQELEEKGNAKKHRGLELNLSSPHGSQPVEDLDSSRDRDGHRRQHEKSIHVCAHADCEHVMGPYTHANEPDRDRGSYHYRITEDRLAREDWDNLGDEGEGWEDQDIDLRMSENPEEMHPDHGGASRLGVEEVPPKIAIDQQHNLRSRKRTDGEDHQSGHHKVEPGEQWHFG